MAKKERLNPVAEFTAEEKAAWDKKSEPERNLYLAKLAQQEAEEAIAKARKDEEEARAAAKRSRALAAGEKKLVSAVRGGGLTLDALPGAIASLVITGTGATAWSVDKATEVREELKPTTDETTDMIARITAEAQKPAPASSGGETTTPAPTFTLVHSLSMMDRGAFIGAGAANPDATLTSLMRRYGMVEPILATPDFSPEAGKLRILRGRRRLSLLPEGAQVPTVIVTGFPDEYTLEAASVALSRGRSLNVFTAGEFINRARQRGKSDAEIRRDVGFKTGEVDKYASATALPPAILEGVKAGRITSATALLVAKQPGHIQTALAALYTERKSKETETAPARLTEADVDNARQGVAAAAVKRDQAQLSGMASAVTPEDAGAANTGATGENAGSGLQSAAPSPASPSPVSAANTGEKNELDNRGGAADNAASSGTGGAWVEGALGELDNLLAAIPQDAPNPVLPNFRLLRDRLIEAGGGLEYATAPEDNPPAEFKADKKKAVANRVEARTGWKASALSRVKPVMESIPQDAAQPVWEAFNALKGSISSAKPGAHEDID